MLINGEKYACEACVRGHRVSSCTHSERKLLHVNKKGRPVSQCPHCRSLRKARSQHVKCECHDKSHAKEDCPHLKNLSEGQLGATPSSCCCGHGERCSCSLKKDHFLENIPEDITSAAPKPLHKFSGPTANSHDTKPTVFTNGHHKPVHKFNDAHNHCGAPYRVPSRSASHHGHREIAQRSSDSLPLTNKTVMHHESPLHNVTNASQQTRQVRSEHNSPILDSVLPTGPPFNVEIPPLSPNAYSYSPFDAQSPSVQPGPRLPETIPDHWFTTHDEAHNYGPPNVPDLGFIDWSNYGFGNLTDATAGAAPPYNGLNMSGIGNAQFPSYTASMDHLGLANSGYNTSSAEISDAEDLPNNTFRPSNLRTISHASNDVSSNGDQDGDNHRLSAASSYFGTPQGNMLAANLEDLDIDKYIAEQKQLNMMKKQSVTPELQKHIQQQPTPPQSQYTVSTPPESIRGFSVTSNPSVGGEHSYTIHEAQAYAHMSEEPDHFATPDQKQTALMQNAGMMDDPMWCGRADELPEFRLDDQEEDEQWVR